MAVNPVIFKAYDVRGLYPSELDERSAYVIGRSFVSLLQGRGSKTPNIIVQSDARSSSPALKEHLFMGMCSKGAVVIDGGLATTPMHYYSVASSEADGGIMVTASHNPLDHNGFKLLLKGAVPLEDTEMKAVRDGAINERAGQEARSCEVSKRGFLEKYISFLAGIYGTSVSDEPFKVVVDAGGGMAGLVFEALADKLQIDIVQLNFEINFKDERPSLLPNRESTLNELKKAVRENNANFGIALDTDGDRVGFVTQSGKYFRADYMVAALAEYFLESGSGKKFIFSANSSRLVPKTIKEAGGTPFESRVGHRFMKIAMRKHEALFGGELSGHFFFKESFYSDSDVLPLLFILKMMSASGRSLDEYLDQFSELASSGELSIKVSDKEKALRRLEEVYYDADEKRKLDGLSIFYDDWWFNVRPSNTEPVLRLIVEAKNKTLVDQKIKKIRSIIG